MSGQPKHNPLKLPTIVLMIVVFTALLIANLLGSTIWWYVAVMAVLIAVLVVCALEIISGRNPWWVRSPFDRRQG